MSKPLLLDLFCGAGGASMGYHRAGFDVIGVDHKFQKRYPFDFIQDDALQFVANYAHDFDVIHASPPCQVYSVTKHLSEHKNHPDLVAETRQALIDSAKPYIIENVPGAPLINPLMLCGTMFNLGVIRHRLFESNPPIWFPPAICHHHSKTKMSYINRDQNKAYQGRAAYTYGEDIHLLCVVGDTFRADDGRHAMQIDWMTRDELAQAIPPAYTEYIGRQLFKLMPNLHTISARVEQGDNKGWPF